MKVQYIKKLFFCTLHESNFCDKYGTLLNIFLLLNRFGYWAVRFIPFDNSVIFFSK
jgi:hypothetical protein